MAGDRGGARSGAGRKRGGVNRAKVDLQACLATSADLLATDGKLSNEQIDALSPLDVMLFAMNREAKAGNWRMAVLFAEKAAPYFHAKLTPKMVEEVDQTIKIKVIGGLPEDTSEAA